MEAVKKSEKEPYFFYLSGDVCENTDFELQLGEVVDRLELNCKGITRFNSIGTKKWQQYFEALRRRGVSLKFHECSTALISQTTMHSSFLHSQEIESLLVPLYCSTCDANSECTFSAQELRSSSFSIPKQKCSCGAFMSVDADDDYFGALHVTE